MEIILHDIIRALEDSQADLGLSYIDEDYGQLEALDGAEDTYPLTFPAVLVNEENVQWQNIAGLSQIGTVTISVKLILDCYEDTHANSTQLGAVIERQALLRSLTELLHGLRLLDNKAQMTRTASQFFTASHGIKVYQLTFVAEVTEDFPAYTKTYKGKNIVIEPTLAR